MAASVDASAAPIPAAAAAPAVPESAMWLDARALNCYEGDATRRSWLLTPGLLTQRIREAAGAGFSLLAGAADQGCTLFVTGEARHHDQLAARARGCDLLLAGHTQTERGYLPTLARLLEPHVPGVKLMVSKVDAPPARQA